MDITLSLSEADFDSNQKRLVREILGLADDAALALALKKLFKAAALEYVNMFVERGMASRADEVRQDRLFFLIRHYYESRVPPESEISLMFQLTAAQSRTLFRNTRARYRTKIGIQVRKSAKYVVDHATKNKETGNFEMLIESDVILEELNTVVRKKEPKFKPVHFKKDSSGQYEADGDTYELLKKEYSNG